MKWPRIALAIVIGGIALVSIFLTASRSAADDGIDDRILRTYMEAPNVVTEIETLRQHGYSDGGARGMLIWGLCGVAGCNSEYLIVHQFSYSGTNPQNRSILARVRTHTSGISETVELVELRSK